MRTAAPVRYPIRGESLTGEEGAEGDWYQYLMSATDQDGRTASLAVVCHEDRSSRPYHVVDAHVRLPITSHPTYDAACKATSVRLRKWLAYGRRLHRIRKHREKGKAQ